MTVTLAASALGGLLAAGCQSGTAPAASDDLSDAAMRSACTERTAVMYGVTADKVRLPPAFGSGDNGNAILDGTVDKGAEGIKDFRCIYDASRALVDVMAMTPDGE